MKCADGLRSALSYSETSVRNSLGEISLLIYVFIYLLFKDAVGKAAYLCTASNVWITMDNKSETVCEETFFVKFNLIFGISLDGLRRATQLMV